MSVCQMKTTLYWEWAYKLRTIDDGTVQVLYGLKKRLSGFVLHNQNGSIREEVSDASLWLEKKKGGFPNGEV
ncbi:MAG: hypothetical protein IKI15_06350 [Lachnospiraceae bacterium]|nr:hypothetical protein [Lachnospiraceae bacterium]